MKEYFYTVYMTLSEILPILITVIGLMGTLIGFVIKLSLNVGKYMQQQESLKEEIKQTNEHNRDKFNDYYDFKYDVSQQLSKIAECIQGIKEDMREVKDDLKQLKESKK